MSIINNLLISLNVVFPICVMLVIGSEVKKRGLVTPESLSVMNKLVFRIFMSSLLFLNITNMKREDILNLDNLKLIGLIWFCLAVMTFISLNIFKRIIKDRNQIPVMVQGAYRANLALFGIPMALSVYGAKGLGLMSLVSAAVIPLTNVMAVALLESYANNIVDLKKILKSITKNPLIICSFIGMLIVCLGIELPELIKNPLRSLGNVATPLSFVVLGATLEFSNLFKNFKASFLANSIKLVFLPLMAVGLGIALGFRNEQLLGIIGATASPGAVSSFIMVKEIGGDEKLAAELVVSSTVFSILTLFTWIFVLKSMGYL